MSIRHNDIATTLTAMAAADLALREQLAATGALFDGYHPDMEALHISNAQKLADIIDHLGGWPHAGLVGPDASAAAWLIAQHAISLPDLQRRVLTLLTAESHSVPKAQIAMLEDRIRCFEGKPQIYGTQFDWDDAGELSPLPIEDPAEVDQRRAAMGLAPLAQKTAELRAQAQAENHHAPVDRAQHQTRKDNWARKVGWKK